MKKKYKEDNYPTYEIVVDDTDKTGIRLLSIVAEPAIEMLGVFFNKEGITKEYQFKSQKDKQIIVGPGMIPDQKILRKDEDGNYYYNIFSKETILKLVQKFNSQGTNRKINVDHSSKMVNAYIMENWIVEDPYYDKSVMYGFSVPVGTWMVSVKVEDEKFWNSDVKELGKFGFSIEGVMGERPISLSVLEEEIEDDIEYFIDEMSYDEVTDLIKQAHREIGEKKIIEFFKKRGVNKKFVKAFEIVKDKNIDIKTFAKNSDYELDYYYYSGPDDDKTRDFCHYLLEMDKVYTDDDIIELSNDLGYDLFEFMGGWNCRHDWVKFRGEYSGDTTPSDSLINNLIEKSVVKQ